MNTESPPIKKKEYPHDNLPQYKTPLAFAEWRVNELKKPVACGIINETIDAIIELVNGILGQYISIESKEGSWHNKRQWGQDFKQFEGDNTVPFLERKKSLVLMSLRKFFGFFLSITAFFPGYLPDDLRRVFMPFFIYIFLYVTTYASKEYNFNIYRLLALLLLYIISYTELTYGRFCILFVIGIICETVLIICQSIDEES
jgi:hypothetical protein